MRTYSHTLLTLYAFHRRGPRASAAAALGATLPDLPALTGAAWLAANRPKWFSRKDFETEVCARSLFARPDAALHSVLPVSAMLALYAVYRKSWRGPSPLGPAFLLGWAGHVVADALTHGGDARPLLWPISPYRFESPVSYRERDRHALPFTIAEHVAVLVATRKTMARIPKP